MRRALALSLDRKPFIDILTEGQGDIGGAMLPFEVTVPLLRDVRSGAPHAICELVPAGGGGGNTRTCAKHLARVEHPRKTGRADLKATRYPDKALKVDRSPGGS